MPMRLTFMNILIYIIFLFLMFVFFIPFFSPSHKLIPCLKLAACSSSISSDSLDNSLLLSNGTYAITAYQCVKCRCDAANNMK